MPPARSGSPLGAPPTTPRALAHARSAPQRRRLAQTRGEQFLCRPPWGCPARRQRPRRAGRAYFACSGAPSFAEVESNGLNNFLRSHFRRVEPTAVPGTARHCSARARSQARIGSIEPPLNRNRAGTTTRELPRRAVTLRSKSEFERRQGCGNSDLGTESRTAWRDCLLSSSNAIPPPACVRDGLARTDYPGRPPIHLPRHCELSRSPASLTISSLIRSAERVYEGPRSATTSATRRRRVQRRSAKHRSSTRSRTFASGHLLLARPS